MLVCGLLAAVYYSLWRSHVGHPAPTLTHQQITFVGNAYFPAISPDGKSVAYVTQHPGSDQKLMVQDLSGGPSLELVHGSDLSFPTWSPNGSELMLSVSQGVSQKEIFVVSRLGGAPRPVGDGSYSCWLPGATQIVETAQNPEFGIWLVDQLSGKRKRIPAPGYQWLMGITCSPKTGKLLILTQTSNKFQIWSMKSDGTEQRKLIEAESGETFQSAEWSRMEDAIYYMRGHNGTSDLVRLSVSGQSTGPSVLVSGLEAGDYLTLSADGSQLAYTRSLSYSNLWLVNLPTPGLICRGKAADVWDTHLQWSLHFA